MWPQSSAIASAIVEAYLSLLDMLLLATGLLHEALLLTGGCLSIVAGHVVACKRVSCMRLYH